MVALAAATEEVAEAEESVEVDRVKVVDEAVVVVEEEEVVDSALAFLEPHSAFFLQAR